MKRTLIVCITLVLIALVGCSPAFESASVASEDSASENVANEEVDSESMASDAPMAASDDALASQSASMAVDGAEAGEAAAASSAGEGTQIDAADLRNRRVIRNANLSVEVADVDAALNAATALSTRFGGYVLSTQTWQAGQMGEQTAARLRFAVPVEQFEAALEAARALGDAQQETVGSQDVTAEFIDLEARLTNLEATATRIRGFLDEAENVEEALAVNGELSHIEEQIEQTKGRLNALMQQTAFSTVEVELLPLPPAADPAETLRTTAQWTPLRTIDDALGVLVEVAQVGLNALIWLLIVGGPLLLMGGACFWLMRRLWRAGRRATSSTSP